MSKWTKTRIKISDKYSKEEKEAIAAAIIDHIQERTRKGRGAGGKEGKAWKSPANEYSKEYKESLDFKFKENPRKGTVDLAKTGDMLDSISTLNIKPKSITIGIDESDPDHGKAEGNIRGTYGKSRGSSKKARPFLDISKGEVKEILREFPLSNKRKREEATERYFDALEAAKQLVKGTALISDKDDE